MAPIIRHRQSGMTLVEVLVSVLILAIGLLGAAAIQLNALKYTDSAAMSSQASFIAYDMMDRIRANVDGNGAVLTSYRLPRLAEAPSEASPGNARDQDLYDFKTNISSFAGSSGDASKIAIDQQEVKITVIWDDTRAAGSSAQATGNGTPENTRTFELTSRIGVTVNP